MEVTFSLSDIKYVFFLFASAPFLVNKNGIITIKGINLFSFSFNVLCNIHSILACTESHKVVLLWLRHFKARGLISH